MKKATFINNAQRKLNKKQRYQHRKLSREEILSTKVSTINPWLRGLVVFIGLGLISVCYFKDDVDNGDMIFLLIFGGMITLFGIFGCRRTISSVVDALSNNVFELIIEGIFNINI